MISKDDCTPHGDGMEQNGLKSSHSDNSNYESRESVVLILLNRFFFRFYNFVRTIESVVHLAPFGNPV